MDQPTEWPIKLAGRTIIILKDGTLADLEAWTQHNLDHFGTVKEQVDSKDEVEWVVK
jgi:hypothetical protein